MNFVFNEYFFFSLLFAVAGFGFLFYFLFHLIVSVKCSEQVDAVVTDVDIKGGDTFWRNRIARNIYFSPIFKYKYLHCWYNSKSALDYTGGDLKKKSIKIDKKEYKKGFHTKIYIDKNNPETCIPTRFTIGDVLLMTVLFVGSISEILAAIYMGMKI